MVERNNKGQFVKGSKFWLGKSRKQYNIGKWMKGKKLSTKTKQRIRKSMLGKRHSNYPKGAKHYYWKGGLTQSQKLELKAKRKKPTICEICGEPGKICFDHHHKTGKFRGWICWRCNIILGHSKDDMELLKKLISYLRKTVETEKVEEVEYGLDIKL